MFSKSEIKARFEAGNWPIDRHGNYIDTNPERDYSATMLPLMLHYRLLAGMTDQEAERELATTYMLSAFEIAFLIRSTKEFIKDVLELDLDDIRNNKNSTATLCGQLVIEVVNNINAAYVRLRYSDVLVDECVFQADQKARESILSYLTADTAPEYWVTANNMQIECDRDMLLTIHEAIVSRDAACHEKATKLKTQARELSEQRNYAGLVELLDQVKAM